MITVTSAKTEKISAAPGAVITTAFTVKNATRDSVLIQPILTLPAGWRTVMTVAPSMIGPVSSDLWLISVVAPSNVPAGRYVIRLRLGIGAPRAVARGDVWGVGTARDSVVISVSDRHEVAIRAAAHPTFVMGGDSYTAKFIVRNRGNVASRIKLRAVSNQGASPTLNVSELHLLAGQTDTITATVAIPANVARSSQQLLEVLAVDQSADSARADASVETTIIPRMNTATPDFWTVPGELSLRAAAPGTGVSPFVASGSGRISQTGDAILDFSLRNSAGPGSIFGERDEYRISLRGKNAGIRLGDNSYGFSLLTSGGIQSTGGELRGSVSGLTGGAYVQHNRWTPNSPTEMAAMVGTSPLRALSASAVMLERGKSGFDARVMSAAAQGSIFGAHLEAEAAKSDSQLVVGNAAVARLYGNLPTFTYDFGAQKASDGFAGSTHASGDAHASLSGQSVGPLILSAMASVHVTNPTPQSLGFGQQIATSTASANLRNGSGLEYERFDRTDRGTMNAIRGNQQSLRLRAHLAAGPLDLLGSVQRGIVAEIDSNSTRDFMTFSGSARANIGSDQYIALFTEVSDGRALAAGGIGTATAGGNTELHVGGTLLRLSGSATAQRDNMAAWVGQADVAVEHQVLRSIVALKGRMGLSGANTVGNTNALGGRQGGRVGEGGPRRLRTSDTPRSAKRRLAHAARPRKRPTSRPASPSRNAWRPMDALSRGSAPDIRRARTASRTRAPSHHRRVRIFVHHEPRSETSFSLRQSRETDDHARMRLRLLTNANTTITWSTFATNTRSPPRPPGARRDLPGSAADESRGITHAASLSSRSSVTLSPTTCLGARSPALRRPRSVVS